MLRDRKTNWEKLRLITPIFAALSMFILTAIWNNQVKLTESVNNVRERVVALETYIKLKSN